MSDDEAEYFAADIPCPCTGEDLTDCADEVRKWFNSNIPQWTGLYVFKARPWMDGPRSRGWKLYFFTDCCGNNPCPSNVSRATSSCKDGAKMFKLIRQFSPRGCFFEGFNGRQRLHLEFATRYIKCSAAQARFAAAKIVLERVNKAPVYLRRGDRIQPYWVALLVSTCVRCRPA